MHGRYYVLLIGLLCVPCLVAQDLGIKQSELDNGLKVVVLPREGVPRVECRLVYNVGSVNDRPGKTGMAHFLEHMMFKGTDHLRSKNWEEEELELDRLDRIAEDLYQARQEIESLTEAGKEPDRSLLRHEELLSERFDEQHAICSEYINDQQINSIYSQAGASGVNAFTSSDMTVYSVSVPSNKLDLFFYVEAERMDRCVLREFYNEREVVLEERRRAVASRSRRIWEQRDALVWEGVPYRNPNLGWESDLRGITRQDMFEYYRTYYVPNNAAVILTGDITLARAMELADRYFGGIERAPAPPPIPSRNAVAAVDKTLYAQERESPSVLINYESVAAHHADRAALEALASWLDSSSGPLYKKLVVNEKLALSVECYQDSSKYGGILTLGATASEQGAQEQLMRRMNEILDSVLKGEVGFAPAEEDLQAYAARVERVLTGQLSDSKRAAGLLVESVFVGGLRVVEKRMQRTRELTPESVLATAARYCVPTRRTTVLVVAPNSIEGASPSSAVLAELIRELSNEEDEEKCRELERLIAKLREDEE